MTLGIVQGPIDAALGLAEGAGSLVMNTFKGVFGSASKITSSASKGLLALANVIFML